MISGHRFPSAPPGSPSSATLPFTHRQTMKSKRSTPFFKKPRIFFHTCLEMTAEKVFAATLNGHPIGNVPVLFPTKMRPEYHRAHFARSDGNYNFRQRTRLSLSQRLSRWLGRISRDRLGQALVCLPKTLKYEDVSLPECGCLSTPELHPKPLFNSDNH